MTVQSDDGPPSLESAARQLGVAPEALDDAFGVVTIDPSRGLYSVQVDAAHLPAEVSDADAFRGPFSTPRIEPFGPVRSEPKKPQKKTR